MILGEASISSQGFWSNPNTFASSPLTRLIIPVLTSILVGFWLSVYLPARRKRQEEAKKVCESLAKLALEIKDNLNIIASIKKDLEFAVKQVKRYSVSDKEMNEAIQSSPKLRTEAFKEYRISLPGLLAGDKKKVEQIEDLYRLIEKMQGFSESEYSPEQSFDHSMASKERKLNFAEEVLSKMRKTLEEGDALLNSLIPS